MRVVLIFLALTFTGCAQKADYFQRVLKSEQVEVAKPRDVPAFFRDSSIPADTGERVYNYFRSHYRFGQALELFAIPTSPLYLASANTETEDTVDGGRRFYLVKLGADSSVSILSTGGGARESWILRPTFFVGQGHVLILAEMGFEYTYGLQVSEIAGDSLRQLGTLNVGFRNPDRTSGSPAANARVRFDRQGYRIEFPPGLLLEPGQKDSLVTIPEGHVAVYQQVADHFIPEP